MSHQNVFSQRICACKWYAFQVWHAVNYGRWVDCDYITFGWRKKTRCQKDGTKNPSMYAYAYNGEVTCWW